uniref:UBX domain-containing protein 4 n=1 Tax=Caligus rogercresseyi TaxID=217165 RepID=C1BRU2_CALRO|nr:UBX domain-containing protein 2 [Caligus rogercresseyi]
MGINWYSGSVASAINESKKQGTTFVVAIVDENGSPEFCSVLESFSGDLSRGVCVKYAANSVEARQFGEFYPVVLVPSLYFIDSANGLNRETTGGHSDPEKIRVSIQKGLGISESQAMSIDKPASKIQEASSKDEEKINVLNEPQTMNMEEPESTSQSSKDSPPNNQKADAPSDEPQPMNVDESEPKDASAKTEDSSSLSLEDRVTRAKELLRQKQEAKIIEESESAKSKEKERRQLGKSLQQFKEEQEANNIKKALEEQKREKEAERIAREKVKAQIALDRENKNRKFNAEKEERQRQVNEKARLAAEEEAKKSRIQDAERSKMARIQFRLPDGRTHTAPPFSADAPLSDLFAYVRNDIEKGFTSFSLSTTFPVKKLDNEDPSSTLKSQELAPSGTVMILPKTSSSLSSQDGGLMSYVWLLLSPLNFIFDMLSSFFSGNSAIANEPEESTEARPRPKTAYKRKSDGGQVCREGNFARLKNDMDDDDDENGTWNGNSTQQM